MMHLRVSKALHADFDYDHAHDVAAADWAGDIVNFSGDAAENIWLEEVKKKFLAAASARVAALGWQALFDIYDADRSGEREVGITAAPCCRAQRSSTWAGVRPSRSATAPATQRHPCGETAQRQNVCRLTNMGVILRRDGAEVMERPA